MATQRAIYLLKVTTRLILMTTVALLLLSGVFALTLFHGERFMVSWACFGCGLLGGFVSIQQRLNLLTDQELELLSSSWFQIVLIPVYGGIFSLVLYLAFLSETVKASVFPAFASPAFSTPPTTADIKNFFLTYPASSADVAKLLFWSFVAGFSERFVPQILHSSEQNSRSGK